MKVRDSKELDPMKREKSALRVGERERERKRNGPHLQITGKSLLKKRKSR